MSTSIFERWVRRIFVEDWSLKLLALAITLVLWFVVSGHDVEREITVKPLLVGKPAPSYEIKSVTATPTHVRVQGPAGSVSALQEVFSEKISLDGRRESFDAPHVAVYTSDPRVEVLDTVSIHVDIGAVGNQKPNPEKTN
jgi:YbbR-like protein